MTTFNRILRNVLPAFHINYKPTVCKKKFYDELDFELLIQLILNSNTLCMYTCMCVMQRP